MIDYFRDVLRLNGGDFEGLPFVLGPWQAFIVGSLFGWLRVDGKGRTVRRFRKAFIEIGKGNGKSPLAAGIGMFCLTSDDEPRAEVYAAATKKDQAQILFRDAVAMREQSPELKKRIRQQGVGERAWNLAFEKTGSWFRPISSEGSGKSGPRPHCSLIDEVHEHPNADVIDMLSLGQKGRRQPLQVEITNSGVDRQSVCYQHHEYSTRVVDAEPGDKDFADDWFAYVCALDKGEDPFEDEACWIKANPNLGVSIEPDFIRGQVNEARGMPSKASIVRRLVFCQWVDAANPWISGDLWLACEDEFDSLAELRECEEVCGSVDLSGWLDLSAVALAGKRNGLIVGRAEFWTPADTLEERRLRDQVPYHVWRDQKWLTATPGRNVDYRYIAQRLVELQVLLPGLRQVCFDPYRIRYLEKALDELGCEIELVPHPQGYLKAADDKDRWGRIIPGMWMPHSIELLEDAVGKGELVVERNPVLTWNSASAQLEADAKGNRIFTKRKSSGRIDGIVALAMAIGLLERDAPTMPDVAGALANPIRT